MDTQERHEQPGGGVTTQVRETGQEVVAKAQEQVQDKTEQVRDQASERLRQEVDRRSTEFGDHGQALAQALRKACEELESQGKGAPAKLARGAAEKLEEWSGYLRKADGDRILGDVEDKTRHRPWLAAGAAAVAGFLASRFVKASSARRYERRGIARGEAAYDGDL
jgi:hypothetical protein